MKKLLQYSIISALGLALLTGCKKADTTPTVLASAGTNTASAYVDYGTIDRTIYVTGLRKKIHEIKVNFQGSQTYTDDVELYLKSPSGKIFQLCADESDVSGSLINVTFTDDASISIKDFTTVNATNMVGTFKPRGSLSSGFEYTGTVTSFNGYKGDSPNGTWTLYISDDGPGSGSLFTSWELFLSTSN